MDSRWERFAMNMQLRQCFARVKLFRLKKIEVLSGFFDFQNKPSALNKSRISKYGLKKSKLATLLHV